jgi:hypothetical protein
VSGSDTTENESPRTAAKNHASSPEWQTEGEVLIADKARSGQSSAYTGLVGNQGGWAYQSVPVDIESLGQYTLLVGPVPDSFDYPRSPLTFAMNTPQDEAFSVGLLGAEMISDGSNRFLQVTVEIVENGPFEPYLDFSVWVY